MLAKREQIKVEMRSILDTANGDLSAESEQRFDALRGELESLEKTLQRREYFDALEKQVDHGDPVFEKEERKFSLCKAIAYQAGLNVDAGLEKEVSQELQRRSGMSPQGILAPMSVFEVRTPDVITTTTPAAGPGSNITPVSYLGGQYIDLLRSALVIRRLGARILSNLTGNIDIPRLKASASTGWVAENAAITASDMQFDKLQMTPKHCGAMVEISRNMIQQSSPDVENLVRDDFAKLLARSIDSAAINGGGANEPTGIIATSGVSTVDVSGGWTWPLILEFISKIEAEDSTPTAWLMQPALVKSLRSTPRATAVYIADGDEEPVDSSYLMNEARSLAGYPVAVSNLVPENMCILGNFADVLIGYWSAFDLLTNPFAETSYAKGNLLVRGMCTVDVGIRHKESFCISDLGD